MCGEEKRTRQPVNTPISMHGIKLNKMAAGIPVLAWGKDFNIYYPVIRVILCLHVWDTTRFIHLFSSVFPIDFKTLY